MISDCPLDIVASSADDVLIHSKNIRNMALENENLDEITNCLSRFTSDFHPEPFDPRAADWLFVLNTMNFALWNPKGTKQWTVNQLTGYQALCAAIKRAIDKEIPIWSSEYYTQLTLHDLEIIFKSDDEKTSIPLIHERLKILHQVGDVLLSKYAGSFMECVKLCEGKPLKLLDIIMNEFESYQDKPIYEQEEVDLYTKAHILVSDIWFYFKEHDEFSLDYDSKLMESTMFADYRIFQVLLHFKVLSYSEELLIRLEKNGKTPNIRLFFTNDELKYGSKEEIEIRSCSIFAIKMLAEEIQDVCHDLLKKNEKNVNYTIIIDNFLWDYRQVYDQLLMETQPLPNIKLRWYICDEKWKSQTPRPYLWNDQLTTAVNIHNWLHYCDLDAPLVAVGTLLSSRLYYKKFCQRYNLEDYGLTQSHFHAHSSNGAGGHFDTDLEPINTVEYLGYFYPARRFYHIDPQFKYAGLQDFTDIMSYWRPSDTV